MNMDRTTITLLQTAVVAALLGLLFYLAGNFLVEVLQLPSLFWVVPLAGGAGGVVNGLIRDGKRFVLCETRVDSIPSQVSWTLGTLGDLVIGMGGAIALMFLFGGALNINFDQPTSAGRLLLTSVSFVAGIVARPLIEAAGQRLISRVAQEAEEAKGTANAANAMTYAILARHERDAGRLKNAESLVDYALDSDPTNPEAHLEKARILKRLAILVHPMDAGEMASALDHAKRAAQLNPTLDVAWYNMACYQARLRKEHEKALEYLKKAIKLEPSYRELARDDEDLEFLRDKPEFEGVVGLTPST